MNKVNHKYISLDVVANRVIRHPLLKDMNYEEIISYTVDVLRLIGVPSSYVEDSCYKNIVDMKAAIPEDSLGIISVDYVDSLGNLTPMVKASDTRNTQLEKTERKSDISSTKYTYSLNNNRIHCNVEEGIVFIIYKKIKTDEVGIPMIPDNMSLVKAIESYIKSSMFRVYADLGKINFNTVQFYEQEYSWYVGQAQTAFQGFENEDDVEAFLSDFKRTFQLENTHKTRHRHNSTRELRFKK